MSSSLLKSLPNDIDFDSGYFDCAHYASEVLKNTHSLAPVIDHTLLNAEATRDQVVQLCDEAAAFRFACVMVNPAWVATARSVLAGCGVRVGAPVGFPLGASLSRTKRDEAQLLLKLGARELEMVINIGLLKSAMNRAVERDIGGVVEIAHDSGAVVKVILETCLLNVEEKLRASELAIAAGADSLKTSTGFSHCASAADVALLRGVAGRRCGVNASGGICTLASARQMLEAGADRLGSNASVAILHELESCADGESGLAAKPNH